MLELSTTVQAISTNIKLTCIDIRGCGPAILLFLFDLRYDAKSYISYITTHGVITCQGEVTNDSVQSSKVADYSPALPNISKVSQLRLSE